MAGSFDHDPIHVGRHEETARKMHPDLLFDLADLKGKLGEKMDRGQEPDSRPFTPLPQGQGARVHGLQDGVFFEKPGWRPAVVDERVRAPGPLEEGGMDGRVARKNNPLAFRPGAEFESQGRGLMGDAQGHRLDFPGDRRRLSRSQRDELHARPVLGLAEPEEVEESAAEIDGLG